MLFPLDPSALFGQPAGPLDVAAFWLVAIAVAIACALRPALGVAALIAVDPFDHARYSGATLISFPKVALAGAAIGLFAYFVRVPAARARLRGLAGSRLLIVALAALAAATALSFAQAEYRFAVIDELVKLRDEAGYFVIALAAGIAEDDLRPFHWACLIVGASVALIAVAEEAGGAASVVEMAGRLVPRVAGPLAGPNQLAGYLQILLPTLVALALARGPGFADLATIALAAGCDVLTLSRNGCACGAIALAVVLALSSGRRWRVVIAVLAGCFAAAVVQPQAVLRFGSAEQSENAGGVGTRAVLWRAAYELWRRHPLLGIGAGNFEFEIVRVGPPGVRTHANDWYIESLVDGGVPLLSATLFTVYAAIASFVADVRNDPIVLAAFAASIGLACASVLDYTLFYPKVADMWWLLLGTAGARQMWLHRAS